MTKPPLSSLLAFIISALLFSAASSADDIVIVGGEGVDCIEDPGCVNRLHPDIPMAARANPGQIILFRAIDARDVLPQLRPQSRILSLMNLAEFIPLLDQCISRVRWPVTC